MSEKEKTNMDSSTVAGFGDEWSRFDQKELSEVARHQIFDDYFAIFPWDELPDGAVGIDVGCGSGRWALLVAPRVHRLILADASEDALQVAKRNLSGIKNVEFKLASVEALPVAPNSLDFAYSLGVLHHVPDTAAAIRSVVEKLKPGAPFLLYLYYAFDNRGSLYRDLWKTSEFARHVVSRLPYGLRYWVSQFIAVTIYWPLARSAWLLDALRICPSSWPLSYYRDKPYYVMRTDALDRFGTQLEQRFTRAQIATMLEDAGCKEIRFSDSPPYWCAVGMRK